jgi:hypothetical protein
MLDEIVIKLKPSIVTPPLLRININGTEVFDGLLNREKSIRHEIDLIDRLNITIHKTGKTKEVVDRKEPQEVLVEEVLLNRLSQHPDKFGSFSQEDNPYVENKTIQGNEMNLNGRWQLDVPVFRQPFLPELDRKQRDQFVDTKTACFGCSFTYGSQLQNEQTWPYHLGDAKNYGVGGNSISGIVGTANWYVENFKCKKLIMLLPHVCRFQINDQKNGLWTFLPFKGERTDLEAKATINTKDIVMFGESSLLFSGFINRTKELLLKINQKTNLYVTSYQRETYDMLKSNMNEVCEVLPFYEISTKYEMAPDQKHPGPEHNKIFADKIRPILGG